ncbi:MAG: hypothetical protein ACYTEQ_26825 [Planctomycetota bacterium]
MANAAVSRCETQERYAQEIYGLCRGRPPAQLREIAFLIRFGSQDPEYAAALRELTGILVRFKHYFDAKYVFDLAGELRRRLPLHLQAAARRDALRSAG